MPTTVHIPRPLLAALDRKAKALQVSRNRLIVRALQREIHEPSGWSPEFIDRLRAAEPDLVPAVDELVAAVVGARRSKAPRSL
jgi:hypothetical protein